MFHFLTFAFQVKIFDIYLLDLFLGIYYNTVDGTDVGCVTNV